jgi:hypothetical protein
VLPVQYKAMKLSELLDNAVRQLEHHTGFTLAVNLPCDLATGVSKQASALWYPSAYLDELEVTSVDQVYGVLSQPHLPLPMALDRTLPLLAFHPQSPSIGSSASDYLQQLGGEHAADAFEAMRPIVDHWPMWVLERAVHRNMMRSANANLDPLRYMFTGFLIDTVSAKLGRLGARRAWKNLDGSRMPNIDHHDIVYELVCMALNLVPEICKRRGLRLIVRKIHPPCIGLTRRSPDYFSELNDADIVHRLAPKTTRTICMARGIQVTGSTLVDALETKDEHGTGHYRIVTIWVPQHSTPFHDLSAMVDARGHDGSLGCPVR